jgi:hypothetical protein
MDALDAAPLQSAGEVEAIASAQLGHRQVEGQERRHDTESVHDTANPSWTEDGDGLDSPRVGDGMQEPRQTGDMVGVRMRYTDGAQAAETPPGDPPGYLRPLPAVKKRQLAADSHQQAGEPAARKRHHAARPQENRFDQRGIDRPPVRDSGANCSRSRSVGRLPMLRSLGLRT